MNKGFKKIGLLLFCLLPFIAAQAIQLIASIIVSLIGAISLCLDGTGFSLDTYTSLLVNTDFSTWIMLLYGLISTLLLGTWYRVSAVPKHCPKRKVSRIVHPKMIAAIVFLAIALQYISGYLVILIALIRPSLYDAYETLMEQAGMDEITLLMVVYSVVVAPICEELIFRGVTLHYAKKALPFWGANLLQAALFGLYHMNVVQGIYAFLVGLFCGYIFHVGKSIYLAIAFHIVFNFLGTAIVLPNYTGNILFIIVAQLFLIVLVLVCSMKLYKNGARICHEKQLIEASHSDNSFPKGSC